MTQDQTSQSESPQIDTLRSVVFGYMLEKQEQNMSRYEMYKWHATEFFRHKVNYKTQYGVKTFAAVTKASENGVIQMPSDFVKSVAVGYYEGGRMYTLVLDNNLYTDLAAVCAQPKPPKASDVTMEPMIYMGMIGLNGALPQYSWSIGGGKSDAYYNENREQKVIYIDPAFYNKQLVIRYISDGRTLNDDSFVPVIFSTACRRWIDYSFERNKGIPNQNQVEYKLREFDREYREATESSMVMNPERMRDFINSLTYIRA